MIKRGSASRMALELGPIPFLWQIRVRVICVRVCKHVCLLFCFFKVYLILEKNVTIKHMVVRIMEELSAKEPLAVSLNLLDSRAGG